MKRCAQCLAEFADTVEQCPQDNIVLESPNVDPLVGTCLADRYQILSLLGSGGMGVVYKAQHKAMDRFVAIKMLHTHMIAKPDALKSFYAEAKTIAQLKHHNIVTLYDFGISPENRPFLVMDYLGGFSLKKVMEQNGALSFERMGPILAQIVEGLAYAHSEKVVHGDLKPENIMLIGSEKDGEKVTLVDFGLAALTVEASNALAAGGKKKEFIGSPYYMSPEQCLSTATVDSRSDIYSLAIVLYEALSGRLPYEAKSAIAFMDSHVNEEPIAFNLSQPGLKVCSEITRVLYRALEKNPDVRYQKIDEFAAQLKEALERDAIKLKAVRHRSLAARQTQVKAQALSGEGLLHGPDGPQPSENNFLELQFQTGRQFLSRQAEIEANFLPVEQESGVPANQNRSVAESTNAEGIVFNLMGKIRSIFFKNGHQPAAQVLSEQAKPVTLPDPREKHCFYCGASVPVGIQFCLNCQRNLPNQAHKLSETYSGAGLSRSRSNNTNSSRAAATKSSINVLRQSSLSTKLAKARRTLNYAVTLLLALTLLIFCQRYGDLLKPVRYLVQFVSHSTGTISANFDSTKKRR